MILWTIFLWLRGLSVGVARCKLSNCGTVSSEGGVFRSFQERRGDPVERGFDPMLLAFADNGTVPRVPFCSAAGPAIREERIYRIRRLLAVLLKDLAGQRI